MEYKALSLDIKAAPDDTGIFEGYGSVFSVIDEGDDVVERGAFAESLKTIQPALLWQHRQDKPIGVYDEIREDDRGLFLIGRLSQEVALAKEATALLKMGAIRGLSIGYQIEDYEMKGEIRHIKKARLHEVSIVTFPMNRSALIDSVKSGGSIQDFEKFLREAGGFSKRGAMLVASKGFRALNRSDSESGVDLTEAKRLQESLIRLQETYNV